MILYDFVARHYSTRHLDFRPNNVGQAFQYRYMHHYLNDSSTIQKLKLKRAFMILFLSENKINQSKSSGKVTFKGN